MWCAASATSLRAESISLRSASRYGSSASTAAPSSAAHIDDIPAAIAVDAFGKREIVARAHRRPGTHRRAEAQPAGFGAVDGYHEDPSQPAHEPLVRMRACAKHPVEHGDRRQVTGAHPDERIPRDSPRARASSEDHNLWRGGCRNCFHDCGPAEWPNSASSSRLRSRYCPGATSTPQPRGRSSAEFSSASTIALSAKVGPTTRYPRSISVDTRCCNPAASITALLMGPSCPHPGAGCTVLGSH